MLTIYRHIYPGEFFEQIQENGGSIEKRYPGVYIISGVGLFKVQVIVGKELAPKEYAILRVLTPDAEEEDIRLFSETIKKRNEAKFREYVDGIYQVSVSANRELYVKMMKEDRGMCEKIQTFGFPYTFTWGPESFPHEVQECFGYYTLDEFRELFDSFGNMRVLKAVSLLEDGYRQNLEKYVSIFAVDEDGGCEPMAFPHSNCIVVAEKM